MSCEIFRKWQSLSLSAQKNTLYKNEFSWYWWFAKRRDDVHTEWVLEKGVVQRYFLLFPHTTIHLPRTYMSQKIQRSMWFYSWLKIGFWLLFLNSFFPCAGWSVAVTCLIRHRLKRKGAIFTLVGADAVLLSGSFSVRWRLASLIIWSAQLGQPLSDYLDIFCSTVDSWIPGDWYRIQEDHGELVQVCSYIIHRTWKPI